jgi:hypothetical protein
MRRLEREDEMTAIVGTAAMRIADVGREPADHATEQAVEDELLRVGENEPRELRRQLLQRGSSRGGGRSAPTPQ